MKIRIVLSIVTILGLATCVQASTIEYDAAADFSASSNPNGAWTYGFCDPYVGTSTFTAFTYNTDWAYRDAALGSVDAWQRSSEAPDPSVTYNDSGNAATAFGFTWQPYALALDSYGGLSPIVRWQVPSDGKVDISATFTNMGAPSTTAYVLDHNGTVVWTSATTPAGVSCSIDDADVFAGNYVYFAINGLEGSVVQLDATIAFTPTVPEPSAVILALSGVMGLLAYAWRKRR